MKKFTQHGDLVEVIHEQDGYSTIKYIGKEIDCYEYEEYYEDYEDEDEDYDTVPKVEVVRSITLSDTCVISEHRKTLKEIKQKINEAQDRLDNINNEIKKKLEVVTSEKEKILEEIEKYKNMKNGMDKIYGVLIGKSGIYTIGRDGPLEINSISLKYATLITISNFSIVNFPFFDSLNEKGNK